MQAESVKQREQVEAGPATEGWQRYCINNGSFNLERGAISRDSGRRIVGRCSRFVDAIGTAIASCLRYDSQSSIILEFRWRGLMWPDF